VLISDCGAKSSMRVTEAVRCKECGHRVMYKPRTHRSESSPVKLLSCYLCIPLRTLS
jgi:DNA-directed RNA polymerase I, II, and III subunit RPABC4